jgi:hypothetical protein
LVQIFRGSVLASWEEPTKGKRTKQMMMVGEEMQRRNANTRGRVGSKLSDREAIIYNHGTLVLPLVHKEMTHQPGTLPPSSSSRASKRVVF